MRFLQLVMPPGSGGPGTLADLRGGGFLILLIVILVFIILVGIASTATYRFDGGKWKGENENKYLHFEKGETR